MGDHATFPEGVAVVGMAGAFPGARSVDEFWENLRQGKESVTTFTAEEVIASGVAPEVARDPAYVKARGLLDDPELFDADFFGVSRREAELMDPQHRLFLEKCWEALEHAGYAPASVRDPVGVWGGMSTGMSNETYLHSNLGGPGALDEMDSLAALLGNENDYLTTRVSYKLDLRGPSVNVQTACSTSLVAVVQAFQSLLTYGCDMALAGGVSVSYPQRAGYFYQEGGIGSPDGRCRPFDERAAGTVFSNGVAVVALKRMEDAVRDGDTIYAVIRGGALNNDGSSKMSFAAPSVQGQAEVIRTAQAVAGVSPESITYVEAHGTGTPIGDPIEVGALSRVFGAGHDEPFCGLGSVKSNFGHLDSAAGIAGFVKTVLCLHHRVLVPTVNFERPNPRIDLDAGPFYVTNETEPWKTDRLPRRAGVSAFGIGGTNAHVVLEEAPELEPPPPRRGPHVLPLSARTEAALETAAERLARALETRSDLRLGDVAHTLQTGREAFRHRAAIVVEEGDDFVAELASLDSTRVARATTPPAGASLAFMFPGGGAQYVHMGRGLYEREDRFRDAVDRGIETLRDAEGIDLAPVLFPEDVGEEDARARLERPSLQLPALYVLETATAELWMGYGLEPAALIGHSLGENTAAHVAGVLDYVDGLRLVTLRGRLFERVEKGGMLSVAAGIDDVEPFLGDELDVAAANAPDQVTLSGPAAPLEAAAARLESEGFEAQMVPIDIAAHSRLVEPILEEFHGFLASIELHPPRIPIVSNRSGDWLTDDEATDPRYWTDHLRRTVHFGRGVRRLLEDEGRVLLEVGPGRILGSLAKLNGAAPERVVSSMRHAREAISDARALSEAVARLWATGLEADWGLLCGGAPARRVALPTYPFQRRRYLVEPAEADAAGLADVPAASARASRPEPASSVGGADGPSALPTAGAAGGDPGPEASAPTPMQHALALQVRANQALLEFLKKVEPEE